MSPVIVRIEHLFDQTPAEFHREVAPFAPALVEVDGLVWKVWLIDAERRASGGIYLFHDRAAAQAYVDGPFCDWMRESSVFSDLRINIFDVVEEPSRITRAPLSAAAARLAA